MHLGRRAPDDIQRMGVWVGAQGTPRERPSRAVQVVVSQGVLDMTGHLPAGTMGNGRENQRRRRHSFFLEWGHHSPSGKSSSGWASRKYQLQEELTFPFIGPSGTQNILWSQMHLLLLNVNLLGSEWTPGVKETWLFHLCSSALCWGTVAQRYLVTVGLGHERMNGQIPGE